MYPVETGQMSAAETGQMSAVETRQSTHNVPVPEGSTVAMFKSQIGGLALNRQKWPQNGSRMVATS